MTKCQGFVGALLWHNYEAQYDAEGEPLSMEIVAVITNPMNNIFASDVPEALRSARAVNQRYVQHVCTRCGDILHRGDQEKT